MNKIITAAVSVIIFSSCIMYTGISYGGDKPLDGKGMNKAFIKEIEKMKAKKERDIQP